MLRTQLPVVPPRAALRLTLALLATLLTASAQAAPPAPAGPHPRLFLGNGVLAALQANAKNAQSSIAATIALCQGAVNNPGMYGDRGYQGDGWSAVTTSCALAWQVTGNSTYATTGAKFWKTLLADGDKVGDGTACSAVGVAQDTAVSSIRRDSGYAIRTIGPASALAYDWLHDAPGVDESLRALSRYCFNQWLTWYAANGYNPHTPGSNYHAGYAITKTLASVAEGGEDGANSDRLWSETVDDLFAKQLVGGGLLGQSDAPGTPVGPLVGGDWGEGWQYGILSVLEYALSARALEEQGVPQPEMDVWANSLLLRFLYALTPARDGIYVNGDFEPHDQLYQSRPMGVLSAVLAARTSNEVASYALAARTAFGGTAGATWQDSLAEARVVAPKDFYATGAPLWYLARGSRNLYVRNGWGTDALWAVFSSAPRIVPDHQHNDASNFVLSRGADHLIVDTTTYGSRSTLSSNAITVDSKLVSGDYAPSQTPWSGADMPWVRGTASGTMAARSDFAKAFNYGGTPSDIPYAHREWAFLPEGEVVTIDRARITGPSMYVRYRALATLVMDGNNRSARGDQGASSVVVHTIALSGGAPVVRTPPVADNNDCFNVQQFGNCDISRMPVTEYNVKVPGPQAMAIHVIDALPKGGSAAIVGSMNDQPYEAAQPENQAVIGAAVFRDSRQSFVIASSGKDGAVGAQLTYGIPGANPSRHVVFDAPQDNAGKATVAAAPSGDRCRITITAGGAMIAQPLMFTVSTAADGCQVKDDPAVDQGNFPPPDNQYPDGGTGGPIDLAGGGSSRGDGAAGGGGSDGSGGGGGGTNSLVGGGLEGGCSCQVGGRSGPSSQRGPIGVAVLGLIALALRAVRRWRPAAPRRGRRHRVLAVAMGLVGALAARPALAGDPIEPLPGPVMCRVKSPAQQMHFTTGLPFRFLAEGFDVNGWAWLSGRTVPKEIQFYLDGKLVDTVQQSMDQTQIDYFEVRIPSLDVGPHTLTVKSVNYDPNQKGPTPPLDGAVPVYILVDAMPAHAHQVSLNADLVLSGANDLLWDDTTVIGNGHSLIARQGYTGKITIRNSFITGLGSYDASGIDVTTSSAVDVESSVFEATGAIRVAVSGSAAVLFQGNEFRANNLLNFVSSDPEKSPILDFEGSSSGSRVFRGNRVAAGIVLFHPSSGWLVGGDDDSASNILMGPRTVLTFDGGSGAVIRGNYLHHEYRNEWSQGFNLRFLSGADNALAEHNVIRHGSWPVQSFGGEFRYNLVVDSGHDWLRSSQSGSRFHHNVWIHSSIPDGSWNGGLLLYSGEQNVDLYNNTFDGGAAIGKFSAPVVNIDPGVLFGGVRNNAIVGFTQITNMYQAAFFSAGVNDNIGSPRITTADYNGFNDPLAAGQAAYAKGIAPNGAGAHDVKADPLFGGKQEQPYAVAEGDVWNLRYRVSQVLAHYRQIYSPQKGSPFIDAGDPVAPGTDIGAVEGDSGTPRPEDRFGRFASQNDVTPPTVKLDAPTPGVTLKGTVTMSATAADDQGVAVVQFLVDQRPVGEARQQPFTATFDSCLVGNGQRQFSARAWDLAGNSADSSPVTATVANDLVADCHGAVTPPDAGAGAPDAGAGRDGGGGGPRDLGAGGDVGSGCCPPGDGGGGPTALAGGELLGGCSLAHRPGRGLGGMAALAVLLLSGLVLRRRPRGARR